MQGIVLITKTGGVIAEESEREQEKRLFQSKILHSKPLPYPERNDHPRNLILKTTD